jgi:hypothetical protein
VSVAQVAMISSLAPVPLCCVPVQKSSRRNKNMPAGLLRECSLFSPPPQKFISAAICIKITFFYIQFECPPLMKTIHIHYLISLIF